MHGYHHTMSSAATSRGDEVLTPEYISTRLTSMMHWAKLLANVNEWKHADLFSLTFILQGFPHNFPLAQTLQSHQASAVAYFSDII